MEDEPVQAEITAEQQTCSLEDAERKYRSAITCFIDYLDKKKSAKADEAENALKSGEAFLIEAAKAGYSTAQDYLGNHYKHGILLMQDKVLSEMWLEKAKINLRDFSYPENNTPPNKSEEFPFSTKNNRQKKSNRSRLFSYNQKNFFFKPYSSYQLHSVKNIISLSNYHDRREAMNRDAPEVLLIKLKNIPITN